MQRSLRTTAVDLTSVPGGLYGHLRRQQPSTDTCCGVECAKGLVKRFLIRNI